MADLESSRQPLLFYPLGIETRSEVERIRALEGHALSAHAFASLFLWQEEMNLSVCLRENALLVRCAARGDNAYFFPCGSEAGKLELLRDLGEPGGLSLHYLREQDQLFLSRYWPSRFVFEKMRGDAEYIYRRTDQLNLRGGIYKNLRAKIHKAQNRYDWKVIDLDQSCLERAADVILRWRGPLSGDRTVAMRALEYFDALGLQGILLENGKGPQAVAIGSCITPDTFDLHVTKTLLPSIDSYLKWELYRRLPPAVQWINQEEDLNLPGLRTNKRESIPYSLTLLWKGIMV